ncbi:MAG: CAP domain-containing protein, partial [Acidimicrobiia bacterium]
LDLINQERAAVGAQQLTLRDDLVQIAAEHSAWMASTGVFEHRDDLRAGVTGPWTTIGENIAYGWSVTNIHRMFMESEGHCRNNLYAGFNRIGIEFATGGNGALYVTVVFVQESGGSLPATTLCPYDYSAPPPTSTTTTTPPPPTSTTTTTAPPPTSTTTTTAPPPTSTTTTTAPPLTTTTAAAGVVLPLSSTTTTSVSVPPAPGAGGEGEREMSASAAVPVGSANGTRDTGAFPIAPLAVGTAVLTAAGAWWLIATKRAATRMVGPATWGIPHGGVRPPQ